MVMWLTPTQIIESSRGVMWLTLTQINESSSGRDIGVMLMWMNSEANQPTTKNCLIVNVDVNQTTQINEPMTTQML